MLQRLVIRNIAVIEEVDINFEGGLCVVTGETGAGKSILLEAIGLALGERADADMIRPGAASASVIAAFTHFPQRARDFLKELELYHDEDEIVCRRVITSDRTSRAYINDMPVSVQTLKKLGDILINIHGQFENYMAPDDILAVLDVAAKNTLTELRAAFGAWGQAKSAYEEFDAQTAKSAERLPYLQQQLKELNAFKPRLGELDELEKWRLEGDQHAKLSERMSTMTQLLQGERPLVSRLLDLQKALIKMEGLSFVTHFQEVVERFIIDIQEFQSSLDDQQRGLSSSTLSHEQVEDRLYALRTMARKYQCLPDELSEVLQRFVAEAAQYENATEQRQILAKQWQDHEKTFVKLAEEVSASRQKAAGFIEKCINDELPALKLEHARVKIQHDKLSADKWRDTGVDRFVLQISTFPGAPFGSLSAVASGGERSRLFLAIQLAIAALHSEIAFVFDEVDSGVGGATASAVGERLIRLSQEGRQVIVITHSPQVAAKGKDHWHVSKVFSANDAQTRVLHLDPVQRQEEIARMLAGEVVTAEARAAAVQLLEAV